MDRQSLLVAVLAICMMNGLFSPFLALALPITTALLPAPIPWSGQWVLFFSIVFVSTATLLFSGVPAALYERLVERNPQGTTAMYVWLGAAALLSLPALGALSRL
jgi:heme/copper-type cytochrome/quinol oxidase subunit 3